MEISKVEMEGSSNCDGTHARHLRLVGADDVVEEAPDTSADAETTSSAGSPLARRPIWLLAAGLVGVCAVAATFIVWPSGDGGDSPTATRSPTAVGEGDEAIDASAAGEATAGTTPDGATTATSGADSSGGTPHDAPDESGRPAGDQLPEGAPAGGVTPTTSVLPGSSPSSTAPPPTTLPVQRSGLVNGCNTYSEDCGTVPIYAAPPPPDYDYRTYGSVTRVPHGAALVATCWQAGGVTYNYAAYYDPPDYGPDPYESNLYYKVTANGETGWIADTYFVRDSSGFGLPACSGG